MKRHRQAALSLVALFIATLGAAAGPAPAVSAQDPDAGLVVEIAFEGEGGARRLPLESVDPSGFTFIDLEQPRALLQIINGCDLNDHFWVFGANLTEAPATLTISTTAGSGLSRTFTLPGRASGGEAEPIIGLEALPICSEIDLSGAGIGVLSGTAQFTGVGDSCADSVVPIRLIPRGRGSAFRSIELGDGSGPRFVANDPVVVVEEGGSRERIILFAEARLPGRVEGVAVTGSTRLLPGRRALDARLGRITDGRVRRAFETALNGRVPSGLIDDLGLRAVDCIYHVRLDFAAADARDRLFTAGWLKQDPEVADLVDDGPVDAGDDDGVTTDAVGGPAADGRFIMDIVGSDGRTSEIRRASGPSERDSQVRRWLFSDADSIGVLVDACPFTGSFWVLLGSRSESGFDLTIFDLEASESRSYSVPRALSGALAPAVVDTAVFSGCA